MPLRYSAFVGLSMEEIKLALTQLALLHATSYHFLRTYPGGEEQFRKDYPVRSPPLHAWCSVH